MASDIKKTDEPKGEGSMREGGAFVAVLIFILVAVAYYNIPQPGNGPPVAAPKVPSTTTTTIKLTLEYCGSLRNGSFDALNCYSKLALNESEINTCRKSSSPTMCFLYYAVLKKNEKACKYIENDDFNMESCYVNVALTKRDYTLCDGLDPQPPLLLESNCKMHYMAVAYQSSGDPKTRVGARWPPNAVSICNNISSDSIRKYCKAAIASDPSICKGIYDNTEEGRWFGERCAVCAGSGDKCKVTGDYLKKALASRAASAGAGGMG